MEKEARRLNGASGVLGCGPIAQAAHFEACRRARNAELYAICDLAEDLVTRMAAIHEPHVTYQDYGAMLADPQVEAVIVATADQFHVEHASRGLLPQGSMRWWKNRLASPSRSAKRYVSKYKHLDSCYRLGR